MDLDIGKAGGVSYNRSTTLNSPNYEEIYW